MAKVTTSKSKIEVTLVLNEEEAKYVLACFTRCDPKSNLDIADPYDVLHDALQDTGINTRFDSNEYVA